MQKRTCTPLFCLFCLPCRRFLPSEGQRMGKSIIFADVIKFCLNGKHKIPRKQDYGTGTQDH